MKLPSFSYSAWDEHTKCPLKYKFKYVEKLCPHCKVGPLERNSTECPFCKIILIKPAAMARGTDHHTMIEQYIKNESVMLPPIGNEGAKASIERMRVARMENPARVLLEKEVMLTEWWTLASEWGPIRGFMDVMILDYEEKTVHVIDWKTGSITKKGWLKSGSESKYDNQLELYALFALVLCPWAEQVMTSLYFLDARDRTRTDRRTWFRDDLPALKNKWAGRRNIVVNDKEFKPNPAWWCNYCEFNLTLGGPCKIEQKPKAAPDDTPVEGLAETAKLLEDGKPYDEIFNSNKPFDDKDEEEMFK